MSDVLIAEISGKRPGGIKERPTEGFQYDYDHVIISNNSDGYQTEWDVINVPDEYVEWYKQNVKTSESAWYAPMNRSYAIKYAREHGYRYLIQLDDNIVFWEIAYKIGERSYRTSHVRGSNADGIQNDLLEYLVDVLRFTNAGITGMEVAGASVPGHDFLRERYVYSAFALDLQRIPDYYQGDFEDDIEFRLKLKQMSIPSVCVCPFRYSKTAQEGTKDTSGNRQAYVDAGVKRGAHMSKLYGEYYSAGMSSRGSGTRRKEGMRAFRHRLKPFKVGVKVSDYAYLESRMSELLVKYANNKPTEFKTNVTDD